MAAYVGPRSRRARGVDRLPNAERSKMIRARIPFFALVLLGAVMGPPGGPLAASAQEDGPSLGDVARNLRKSKSEPPPKQAEPVRNPSGVVPEVVIDNENLIQVMEEAQKTKPSIQDKTVFSIGPSGNTLRVSSPDATCSLSFNARAGALLIKPVLVEDLPLTELMKLDGPGSIQDESLQIEMFNGTEWDLREITIGLTLERKPEETVEQAARARVIPAAEGLAPVAVERRSDVTLLYHLKTEAKPFSKTEFHENIGIAPGADEDWRWSIVEAKGIRPAAAFAPQSLSEPLFGDPLPFVPSTNDPGAVPTKNSSPQSAPAQIGQPDRANTPH